ncbi:MAG: rod shape-determining protein MreD [Alphaproteobacteria bacterium]|nr:rod shape-determining protein MreD [Alphaproteobacteria bacterium]
MTLGLGRRLALAIGRTTPALLTLLLGLPALLPIDIGLSAGVTPMLAVVATFYWSIYRPELLPTWAAFAIGLALDLVSGGPVGLTALLLVLIRAYVANERRVFLSRSFAVGWGGFALIAGAVSLIAWIAASAYYGQVMRPGPAFLQVLLTIAVYPPLYWLLARAQVGLMRQV